MPEWGGPRRLASPAIRNAPFAWNRAAKAQATRHKVFALSLGDFFDRKVPKAWRDDAWAVIRDCEQLDWLILTKRPQHIPSMLPPDWDGGWRHVWLGATVENTREAERRIPKLLAVPARYHWLSCEPLIEPLDLRPWLVSPRQVGINWIVVGGESGADARLMREEWAADLLKQCARSRTAFFLKQMTQRAPIPAAIMLRQWPDQLALDP